MPTEVEIIHKSDSSIKNHKFEIRNGGVCGWTNPIFPKELTVMDVSSENGFPGETLIETDSCRVHFNNPESGNEIKAQQHGKRSYDTYYSVKIDKEGESVEITGVENFQEPDGVPLKNYEIEMIKVRRVAE